MDETQRTPDIAAAVKAALHKKQQEERRKASPDPNLVSYCDPHPGAAMVWDASLFFGQYERFSADVLPKLYRRCSAGLRSLLRFLLTDTSRFARGEGTWSIVRSGAVVSTWNSLLYRQGGTRSPAPVPVPGVRRAR
jgi:hypothetical protein